MCLAQGPQRSDAGEARTRYPSVRGSERGGGGKERELQTDIGIVLVTIE